MMKQAMQSMRNLASRMCERRAHAYSAASGGSGQREG